MESFKPLLGKLAAGAYLSRAEAAAAFDAKDVMSRSA